ncbi:MAG: hypothetical protein WC139_07200 [Candidatus Kapaibacterium sp.]
MSDRDLFEDVELTPESKTKIIGWLVIKMLKADARFKALERLIISNSIKKNEIDKEAETIFQEMKADFLNKFL